jgi:L-alanine-DL-glutamate epimerase-like enolase superfamily enzyme
MVHAARALGMKIMIGCMIESSVLATAAAHLTPLVDYADIDGPLLITDDPFVGVSYDGARLRLPDAPGLGVVPRPST